MAEGVDAWWRLLLCRMPLLLSCFQRTAGLSCNAMQSNSLLYICTPNRGNAAAKVDRAKLFAARALAA